MTTIQEAVPSGQPLKITVVSDFICPWCYLGLDVIERLRNTYQIEMDWAPFFLDPSIPLEGRHRTPQTNELTPKSDLEKRGEDAGIEFRRGRTFVPHTHLALQAAEFSHDHGTEQQVFDYHRALFKAYFTDFENLMDVEVLAKHAEAVGLDAGALRRALAEGAYVAIVDKGIEESYAIGVTGIPTFILNDQYAIVGAQEYDTFVRVMEHLGVPKREPTPPEG